MDGMSSIEYIPDTDFAYFKSDKHLKDSFGKEAIETIMKHLDPPSAVLFLYTCEKCTKESSKCYMCFVLSGFYLCWI